METSKECELKGMTKEQLEKVPNRLVGHRKDTSKILESLIKCNEFPPKSKLNTDHEEYY